MKKIAFIESSGGNLFKQGAMEVDARIVDMIKDGQIDGVMFVSAEPEKNNRLTLEAVIGINPVLAGAATLPGFLVNVCFGTFVEAAYPFMFSSRIVFAGALISACVSGALVGLFGVRGTACVPSASPWVWQIPDTESDF